MTINGRAGRAAKKEQKIMLDENRKLSPLDAPHDDDLPKGRLLSRKEALTLMTGALALAGARIAHAEAPERICVARPEMTEGPFYVDTGLERSDIRVEPADGSVRPGTVLDLHFNVSQLVGEACVPLAGAVVDIWHCDAAGVYSGVQDGDSGAANLKFLRGYQITDADGAVHFTTIYPGWYRGRAVHIHFKIHGDAGAGKTFEFTSQLFFDDALSDKVFATAPYAGRGDRDRRNADDGIFRNGGDQLLLNLSEKDGAYLAAFDIAIDTSRPVTRER